MIRRKIVFLFVIVVFILAIGFTLSYYFFFTSTGSGFITKTVLSKYVESKDIDIQKTEGSLSDRLLFKGIEIKDPKGLPKGSILKIQRLEVYFASFSPEGLNVKIGNGRLNLPNSELIYFDGTYKNGSLDLNAYSRYVDIRGLFDLFTKTESLENISGEISDLDVYVKGSFLEPELTGKFRIKRLSRNGFSIIDCPGLFTITLKDIKDKLKVKGEITAKGGTISARKTTVKLQQSRIYFSGDPKRPRLDLKGDSHIERVKINIVVKGTMDAPDLKLTSEPPMAQERLLVMLATGKSWKGTEASLGQKRVSPDLAADFIDYFVFAGSGGKIAEKFGISDISVRFESETKGIGIKKEVSDKAEASYGIEQSQTKDKIPKTTQKVGGEYKITEDVSIGGEKELKQENKTGQAQEKEKADDKVTIKFKKQF
ncbi:MAG: translocation/assembly module TamB domain-containing protein [Candidatus Omnitrophota bacterium]